MLRGDRVTLRAIERSDTRTFWAYNNDLELELLSSLQPPSPVPLAWSEARFDRRIESSTSMDDLWFAIEVDGRVIGACGLGWFQKTAGTCVMGIRIGERTHWGRGYGREAVALLLGYGFRRLGLHRVWLTVIETNERAIRSYLACGFTQEAVLRRHLWVDGALRNEVLMGILRSEWNDRPGPAD
jgi:RimJ/RimL family protein N-acetyltransferase